MTGITKPKYRRTFGVLACLAVIGAVSIAYASVTGRSICPFLNITGIPCPSCGMTRACLRAARLDFRGAFEFHPLFWVIPVIPLLSFINERGWIRERALSRCYIGLAVLTVVVWVVRL
jgi:hypothetical protein